MYTDHTGSQTTENFLTTCKLQGPQFWGSLLPRPVRATNSRASWVPAAQEAPVAPRQGRSTLVYTGGHTSPYCFQSCRGDGLCCPTSGCNMLRTDSAVGLGLEQEGREGDFSCQIYRKNPKSDSGKGETQTRWMCTVTVIVHIRNISCSHA